MSRYQFLPMSAADLTLVRRWLAAPHVTQWWGDPDEQFGLVSEDLEQPAMDQFVVTIDGPLDAEAIVRKAMDIAADICVYTNRNITVETLQGA